MNRTRASLENLVVVAIVFVLAQTFLEDLAVVVGWSWDIRRVLMFTGFAFDIFFTIEFLTRLYHNFINRRVGIYFWHERGWIDLLASIPLLLLSSGPAVLAYWSGTATVIGIGGILNVLKVVKAIRVARILRLLRVLKIFARIRNTDSAMAQRHVAKITTVAVSVLVAGILVLTVVSSIVGLPSLEFDYRERTLRVMNHLESTGLAESGNEDQLSAFVEVEESILIVQRDGETLYSRYSDDYYTTYIGPADYGYGEEGDLRVFFDLRPVDQEQSRTNMLYFVIIVLIVIAYMIYYSPHFALTVSDPIHVMRRGMSEKGYNLEVKIPPLYRDDEIYRLGKLYNEVYLPLKDRTTGANDSEILDLKLDDIKDILQE